MLDWKGSATALAALLALSQSGCDVECTSRQCEGGSDTGGSSTGGTSTGGTGGAGGAAECSVLSIAPSTGAATLTIDGQIRIHWSEAVDAATVMVPDAVKVLAPDGTAVLVSVTLEDDSTALVTPQDLLRIWQTYTVQVAAGVTASSGHACAPEDQAIPTSGPLAEPRPLLPAALDSVALLDGKAFGVSSTYRGVQVVDLGIPPNLSGAVPTPESPTSLVPAGDTLAFASAGYDGVVRFRRSPLTRLDVVNTPGRSADVAPFQSGGLWYVAVADRNGGVRLLSAGADDGSTPMADLGAIPAATGTIRSVEASPDGTLIVARNDDSVFLLTSATPTMPSSFQAADVMSVIATDLLLDGQRLFVGKGSAGISSYDVTVPDTPVLEGTACNGNPSCVTALGLSTDGTALYAVVNEGVAARFTVDAATGALALDTTYLADSPVHGIASDGAAVFLATEEGVALYPIEGAPSASWEDRRGFGIAVDAAAISKHVYTSSNKLGMVTFDWAAPDGPTRVDQDLTPGVALDNAATAILADGDRILFGDARGGTSLFTTKSPGSLDNPALAGSTASTDNSGFAAIVGDLAYVCDGGIGVQVVDLSSPGGPGVPLPVVFTLSPQMPSACRDVIVVGNRLYVVGYDHQDPGTNQRHGFFRVADLTNPAAPVWLPVPAGIGDFPEITSIARSKGRFFVTTQQTDPASDHGDAFGIAIIDVPAGDGVPVLAWSSGDIGSRDITGAGDFLIVARGNNGVSVYESAAAAEPTLLGTFATSGTAWVTRIDGDGVLVAERQGGVERFKTGVLSK